MWGLVLEIWKAISKRCEGFSPSIKFQVGIDPRTKFWLDHWCGYSPLKDSFSHAHFSKGCFDSRCVG